MNRGLGYRPDPAKPPGTAPDHRAHARLGAGPIPDHINNGHLVLSVLDQGHLSSCVANAVCQAVRAAQYRTSGVPGELGSRLFLYYLARAALHEESLDNGTYIRLAFEILNRFGIPPESAFTYTDQHGRYQDKPGISAFRLASDQRAPTTYLRIDDDGAARVDAVRRALAAGYLVVFGTDVSQDFCDNRLGSAPLPPPVSSPIVGGHAMTAVGYDFRGAEPYVEVVNSWGEAWGDVGYWRMSPEYLTWGPTNDLWIAEATPVFVADTHAPPKALA